MILSVIIPTCNRNDLLAQCLDRVNPAVQKAGFEYEVIITDDSVTNAAAPFIQERYPWARCVPGPKRGPAANRNNGAKLSQGEWLAFIDDDCIPDEDFIRSYGAAINTNASEVIEGMIYSDKADSPFLVAPVNTTGGHLWSCNFGIKRTLFDAIGGFDENYKYPNLEDNDLNKRLVQHGDKIIFYDTVRVYHPLRKVAGPKKFAKYHESWLYYHAKFGDRRSMGNLLKTIIRARLTSIKDTPKGINSIKALYNLNVELLYTLIYSRKWKKY